ncbi:hypothetical protein NA57DRAFT_76250 [Rhizodiscina lignyota]|uniref:MYND-type domain-containing protein n=1 Tax=Rhizodiscina lignyota TaxID=1504668 RepID=A0A9P4IDU8_9PEZI|nr:hypothetical protein NA57DRAFT_76250 [Rhizodiscina lignyota]
MDGLPPGDRICKTCEKKESKMLKRRNPKSFICCPDCGIALYCSPGCRDLDWPLHATFCDWPNVEFHLKLIQDGIWLRSLGTDGHPHQWIYALLLDSYRYRIKDEMSYFGKVDHDSIYGGGIPKIGFEKFLIAAEKNIKLPFWWTEEMRKKCIKFGAHSGLYLEITDDWKFRKELPTLLLILAEKILGSPAGEQPEGN